MTEDNLNVSVFYCVSQTGTGGLRINQKRVICFNRPACPSTDKTKLKLSWPVHCIRISKNENNIKKMMIKKKNTNTKALNALQVMAVDQESGDATCATVVVEVLPEGQPSKRTLFNSLLIADSALRLK